MITAQEFKERFDSLDGWIDLNENHLIDIGLNDEDKSFLLSAGLPISAPPFLSFEIESDKKLKTLSDMYDLPSDFSKYVVIGSNGYGDPVCFDTSKSCEIVYLNHDHDFARILINSSVIKFAESLLAYQHLIEETNRLNGEDAFLDGDIPDQARKEFIDALRRIDPDVLEGETLWISEINECQH